MNKQNEMYYAELSFKEFETEISKCPNRRNIDDSFWRHVC